MSGTRLPQKTILNKLAAFCRKYNTECKPHQKIDSKLIEMFEKEGYCSGFVARFFGGLALEKRSKSESKSMRDDFTHFKNIINQVAAWDGEQSWSPEEKKELLTLIYQLTTFQNPTEVLPIAQTDYHLFLTDTEGKPLLNKEFSIVGDFTVKQLKDLLPKIQFKDRMINVSSHNHVIGIYNEIFFDPNQGVKVIEEEIKEEAETKGKHAEKFAMEIFTAMGYINLATLPSPLSIGIFVSADLKPEDVRYPSHTELLSGTKYNIFPIIYNGVNALFMAAKKNCIMSLQYHLKEAPHLINVQTREEGITPLMMVIGYQRVEAATLLVNAKADVNLATSKGHTALWIAAECGNIELIKLLISAGANPNHKTKGGYSLLDSVIQSSHSEESKLAIIKELINANINVNVLSLSPFSAVFGLGALSPLSQAVSDGHIKIVKLLLESHADPNLVGPNGNSALLLAVSNEDINVVKLLLKYGADPFITYDGKTPLEHASTPEIKTILEQHIHDTSLKNFLKMFPAPVQFSEGFGSFSRIATGFNLEGIELRIFSRDYLNKTPVYIISQKYIQLEEEKKDTTTFLHFVNEFGTAEQKSALHLAEIRSTTNIIEILNKNLKHAPKIHEEKKVESKEEMDMKPQLSIDPMIDDFDRSPPASPKGRP